MPVPLRLSAAVKWGRLPSKTEDTCAVDSGDKTYVLQMAETDFPQPYVKSLEHSTDRGESTAKYA